MTILEFAKLIGVSVVIKSSGTGWRAHIEPMVEIMDRGMLSGFVASADDPNGTLPALAAELRGKRIVRNAYDKERRHEYEVPESLEG